MLPCGRAALRGRHNPAKSTPSVRRPHGRGASLRVLTLCLGYWARHSYFNSFFNLEEVDDDCDYAVFDDLSGGFKFWNNYKGWLGCQEEFTLTDKYRGKRRFMWGRPSIMCMNDDPELCSDVDLNWLRANCFIVYIDCSFITPRANTQ